MLMRLARAAWLRIVDAYVRRRYNARMTEDGYTPVAPPRTCQMEMRGTVWARTVDGGWREICDTCGGNCGQCGMTERLGNPGFSLDRIINKTGMNNPPAGLPLPQ